MFDKYDGLFNYIIRSFGGQPLPWTSGESMALWLSLIHILGIPNPQKRIDQYPHEFSGGMRQRAMIAMAMSCNPKRCV